jgi:Chain length determinant protein
MQTPNADSSPSSGPAGADSGGRLVYVVSQDALAARADDQLDLLKLWNTLWRSRWLIVGITAAFALASAVYASLLPPVYTANVVLAPVKDDPLSGLAGQLGGLANLAGIGAPATDNVEAVAVLRSRDFVRAFIEDQARMQRPVAGRWSPPPIFLRRRGFSSETYAEWKRMRGPVS